MRFVSTRGNAPELSFSEAIRAGLASDGGLYVPAEIPRKHRLGSPQAHASLAETTAQILQPWLACDPLGPELAAICREAFTFPAPLRQVTKHTWLLELFHGPTAAFKDFGARFLAQCLARDPRLAPHVLVATSGDTGGAVAAAFYDRLPAKVTVLYPEGRVSPRQEHQLCAWGRNVQAIAVRGTFDDCQRLVKQAFQDSTLRTKHRLTSANSINLGRLIPQISYYAHASLEFEAKTGQPAAFVIPTGNLGNAVAALYAREMGLPIGRIVFACNANRGLVDLVAQDGPPSGVADPLAGRATIPTLANAMDVAAPSNLERLIHLYPTGGWRSRHALGAASVDDAAIRDTIAKVHAEMNLALCPHTAVGWRARETEVPLDEPAIVVATAHPAKFETIVEPLIHETIVLPESLSAILSRKPSHQVIDAELGQLALQFDF